MSDYKECVITGKQMLQEIARLEKENERLTAENERLKDELQAILIETVLCAVRIKEKNDE